MTVADITRKAGPYTGNGSTTEFPFTFKVFEASDLVVARTSDEGEVTLKLNTDYSVTLNDDQDNNPGGKVTLASALGDGLLLAIVSAVDFSQLAIFTNKGGFYPETLNECYDKLTILCQQLKEELSRAVTVDATDTISPAELKDKLTSAAETATVVAKGYAESAKSSAEAAATSEKNVALYAETAQVLEPYKDAFSAAAGVAEEVKTVAANVNSVKTVAQKATAVSIVSDNISTVATAAGLAPYAASISAISPYVDDLHSVGQNISSVTTTASAIDSVKAVATNAASVKTVAGNIVSVNAVSENIAAINDAADDVKIVATNVSNVEAVAQGIAAVSAVSGNIGAVATVANNVETVTENANNIKTVADNIAVVKTVGDNIDAVSGATAILPYALELTALSSHVDDLHAVGQDLLSDSSAVKPVAAHLEDCIHPVVEKLDEVHKVGVIASEVATVAGIATDIQSVSASMDAVKLVSENISSVEGAAGILSTHRTDPNGHPLATQTTPGFMSAADKVKLDNAEALADGAVTEAKLGAACVTETKLASNAVTETKIADGSVTTAKLSASVLADYAKTSAIPTKTSQLANDSGFALTSSIPTKVSQLTNDTAVSYESQSLTTAQQKQALSNIGAVSYLDNTLTEAQAIQTLKNLKFDVGSAAFANSIWGGRNLLDIYTEAQINSKVAAGDFSGMFIGDYITKTITVDGTAYTVKWLCAGFDHYLGTGDTNCETHHIAMLPEGVIGTAQMNSTNTTAGGFKGSAMWTTVIPKYVSAVQSAFGSAHVLKHRDYMSNQINTSLNSMAGCGLTGAVPKWGCEWTDVYLSLLSEIEVYGSMVASSSTFDIGVKHQQLPLFKLKPQAANCRSYWWLSAVASSNYFAYVNWIGGAVANDASSSHGVRPLFLWS